MRSAGNSSPVSCTFCPQVSIRSVGGGLLNLLLFPVVGFVGERVEEQQKTEGIIVMLLLVWLVVASLARERRIRDRIDVSRTASSVVSVLECERKRKWPAGIAIKNNNNEESRW